MEIKPSYGLQRRVDGCRRGRSMYVENVIDMKTNVECGSFVAYCLNVSKVPDQ
jgi:hypothetical protein